MTTNNNNNNNFIVIITPRRHVKRTATASFMGNAPEGIGR